MCDTFFTGIMVSFLGMMVFNNVGNVVTFFAIIALVFAFTQSESCGLG